MPLRTLLLLSADGSLLTDAQSPWTRGANRTWLSGYRSPVRQSNFRGLHSPKALVFMQQEDSPPGASCVSGRHREQRLGQSADRIRSHESGLGQSSRPSSVYPTDHQSSKRDGCCTACISTAQPMRHCPSRARMPGSCHGRDRGRLIDALPIYLRRESS